MKALTLALILSLPVPRFAPPSQPVAVGHVQTARKGGKWYMAATGHAVYCYGPVMTMPEPASGGLLRVATFCRGDQTMVPLKD